MEKIDKDLIFIKFNEKDDTHPFTVRYGRYILAFAKTLEEARKLKTEFSEGKRWKSKQHLKTYQTGCMGQLLHS